MKMKLAKSLALAGMIAAFSAQPLLAAEKTVVLDVENMTCALCPITVKKSLQKVDGVSNVEVSFDDKTATVTFEDTRASVDNLVSATTNVGYPSKARSM